MRNPSLASLTTPSLLTMRKPPLTNRCARSLFWLDSYPFCLQSFFSSSEKPDFNPTIPEFTSEKFYEGEWWTKWPVDQNCLLDAATTEGNSGQSQVHHESKSHNHFHSHDHQDTTLEPFRHEIIHDDSEEFTIKPFSHDSFNGMTSTSNLAH